MKLRVLKAFLDKEVGQVFECTNAQDCRILLNGLFCEQIKDEPETTEAPELENAAKRTRKRRRRRKPKPKDQTA